MNVLLINIALREGSARKFFPIGLGYIATAIKRAGIKFELLDLDAKYLNKDDIRSYFKIRAYDVVLMGCIVTGYKHVKWLSNLIYEEQPKTKIVAGNSVASSIPDILLNNTAVDIAVMGEGDVTVVELLNCLKNNLDIAEVAGICYMANGKIVFTPARSAIADINSIPFIDWRLFDVEFYIDSLSKNVNEPLPPIPREQIRAMPLNTARGCPFNCTFCYHVFAGAKYRYRTPQSIIEEMRICHEQFGINYFTFNDELTFFSTSQADAFAEALLAADLPIWWDADCRSGMFKDDSDVDVAKKLKDAGCLALSFSLESANPEILKWMDKKVGPDSFSRQCEILKKAGLPSLTSIVIGYPNETVQTIRQTIDCCIENNIYPSAGYLLPQPGTPMYDYAYSKGIIKNEEEFLMSMGDRQDLCINMTSMSDEEMVETVKQELARCSAMLNMDLGKDQLLKTGHYRVGKK